MIMHLRKKDDVKLTLSFRSYDKHIDAEACFRGSLEHKAPPDPYVSSSLADFPEGTKMSCEIRNFGIQKYMWECEMSSHSST